MSVENGARFIELLKQDKALRARVRAGGEEGFLEMSAQQQASCTPFEVVSALLREMDDQ